MSFSWTWSVSNVSLKSSEFFTWCRKLSRCGPSRLTRYLASLYIGAPVVLIMDLRDSCFNSQFFEHMDLHGFTTATCHCQLLQGRFWGGGTQQDGLQANMFILLYGQHICYNSLTDWKSWKTSLTASTTSIPIASSPRRLSKMATFSSWMDIDIYIWSDGSMRHAMYRKPTHTSLCWNVELHYHPASRHSVLSTMVHWTRTISSKESLQENWNSFIVCSNRTATVTSISIVLSIHLQRGHLERVWHQCFLTLSWTNLQLHHQGADETYQNCRPPAEEVYKLHLACQGWPWLENTWHLQYILWKWKGPHWTNQVFHWDQDGVLGASGYIIWTNQPWPSTA